MPPLVSILMPNYNCGLYIGEAIKSILNQTYRHFEFIIIDDCSSDNSFGIIKKYASEDKRIKYFKNKQNLGLVQTRNLLFERASKDTKYYAIMDSDDISLQTRLEEEVSFLELNKNVGVVGSNIIIINDQSAYIGKRIYKEHILKKDILIKNPLAQPSCLIRKEAIEKIGTYTKGFDRSKDYDLWIRIFEFYEIKNIQKFLLKYRVFSKQGKSTHLRETLISTIYLQTKYFYKYFNFKLVLIMAIELILLILPKKFVLWLFKKYEYQK